VNDERTAVTGAGPPPDDTSRPLNGYLEVLFGPKAGRQFVLAKDTVVIGRGDDADFVLDDPTMSRRHAAIRRLPDGFHLTDLGGSNGTLVNGKAVSEIVLDDGMTVEVGTTVLSFRAGLPTKSTKTDDALRVRDTQKLPALGAAGIEGTAQVRTATQPGMRKQPRRGVPSASLSQLVSWVVILALVAGGILLALALLDYSSPPQVESKDLPDQARQQTRVPRQRVPAADEGTFSVAAAPDVAQERLRVAIDLENAGNLPGALAVFEEINARYPEFIPPAGPTVPERVDTLKKKIQFGELLARAQALFDNAEVTPRELKEMGDELGVIPTSDKEFGEKAHQLTEALRLRVKELEAREAEDRLRKVEGEEEPATEGATSPQPPAATPSPKEESSSSDEVRSKAKSLYKKGEFDEAVSVLRAASSGSDGESLGRLAGRIEAFGKTYKEALATSRDAGLEDDAVDLLEKARALDGDLYGAYRSELDDLLASTSVALAQRKLSDGDFGAARRMLDTARKYSSANKEVGKLQNLFSFKAAQLVKQARETSDAAAAIELADQAILLAGPDSSAGSEAASIKKNLEQK